MNQEIKARWTAALRSGEYAQGQGALSTVEEGQSDEFCCLGVLCDLAVRDGVIPEPILTDFTTTRHQFRKYGHHNADRGDDQTAVLPGPVMTWAGLDDPTPRVAPDTGEPDDTESLTTLNDSEPWHGGLDFNGIADAIDASL